VLNVLGGVVPGCSYIIPLGT